MSTVAVPPGLAGRAVDFQDKLPPNRSALRTAARRLGIPDVLKLSDEALKLQR